VGDLGAIVEELAHLQPEEPFKRGFDNLKLIAVYR